jgi:hypothetical protein
LIPTLIAVGIIGLLLGFRFRISTLVFANAIMVCAIVVWGTLEGWSIATTVMMLIACLTVASGAYLLGLSLFSLLRCVSAKPGSNS